MSEDACPTSSCIIKLCSLGKDHQFNTYTLSKGKDHQNIILNVSYGLSMHPVYLAMIGIYLRVTD